MMQPASRIVLSLALGFVVMIANVQADILHGLGNIGDGGASNPAGLKFPGIMASQRGLNFGGPTLPYNFAAIGSTSTSVLASGGQVAQLAAQVSAGNVTLALMSIGDNDWFPNATNIATGALSGAALASFEAGVVSRIETGVNTVLAAGGHVVMGGFSNIVDSPAAAAIAANPVYKANLEGALAATDTQLRNFALANNIPFIDFFALEKMVYDSGHFEVGGVNISLTTVGPDPHNFFQDSLNAGVVIRAEIANLWLQAMNEAYGTTIPLLSDLEILTLAGIGNEYVHETFAPATNFAAFVAVPEPSGWLLAALALPILLRARTLRRACRAD
jgi:hypothetical protein